MSENGAYEGMKNKKWLLMIVLAIGVIVFGFQIKNQTSKIQMVEEVREDGSTLITYETGAKDGEYRIYQLPMTDPDGGCAYAVKLPNGKLIVIDGGYESDGDYMNRFIKEQGGVVDSWILTHPHFDHIGAFLYNVSIPDSGITVEKVYYSPFTQAFYEEEAEEKDLELLNKASRFPQFEQLRKGEAPITTQGQIQFLPMQTGDILQIDELVITCLNSFRSDLYDVNGNSLVLHMDVRGVTTMITGDATDATIADMIARFGKENPLWKVEFLQIPHHGYLAGISNDELYQLTTPKKAFLDCSTNEYQNNMVGIQEHLKWVLEKKIGVLSRFEGPNEICIL